MNRIYIIIGIIAAIVIGLVIGFGVRGVGSGGDIGVVELEGTIISSRDIVDDLKLLGEDPSIQAIIFRVDSPGGIVAASQEIYAELQKIREKKKVVASMGTVAASGGYYVCLPAHVIVANPGTITGSIGVIMELPILEKLLKKVGIDVEVIKSKDYKDIGSPFRSVTEKEKLLLRGVVLDVYEQFVEATIEARELPRDSVLKFADGRIFTGRQAKEYGFVDTLGSFEDAVTIAGNLIGIEKPRLVYPPKRISILDLFIRPMERLLVPRLQFIWR